MSKSVIGALRVNLGLDSANFERGVNRSRQRLREMRSQFNVVAGVAAAFGAAVTAAAMKGADAIDRTAKAARRLDASFGGYQALELAASEAGVPISRLADNIQTVNRELANIGVSGNADRALSRLGISAADLAGVDADEKLARIADAVKAAGLSAGEATAVLRDLGVRNREMVLMMIQGGDAIRKARADIEAYGLSLSAVDAGRIEAANDKIGRLAYIGKYAGQQLALALVPALGDMAARITDSLRAGGLLREVIDGLVANLGRVSTYVATAATAFGVRYVGALAAARLATMTFAGSLAFLRGALIRTGVGALIVAAGEMVYQFTRLVGAAGGFGNAMEALGQVAAEVWKRIGQGGRGLAMILNGVATGIAGYFVRAFAWIQQKWDALVNKIAEPFNKLMEGIGVDVSINKATLGDDMAAYADELVASGVGKIREGGGLFKDAFAPLESIGKLRDMMKGAEDATKGAKNAADDLAGSLGGDGDGGSSGGAAGAAKKTKDALTDVERQAKSTADRVRGNFTDSFKGIVTGAKSMREGLSGILSSLADIGLTNVGNRLFGGVSEMLGNALTPKIPGFANGTNSAPGGLAWVGEQGRELVRLPGGSQVVPNHKLGGGGSIGMRATQQEFVFGDNGEMMARFRVVAQQESRQASQRMAGNIARDMKHQPKSEWGLA